MSDLRIKTIRLAHAKRELRPLLLPLLKAAGVKVAYSLNVGSTSLKKARTYAEEVFGKSPEEVLPNFDVNYKRLQKAVKVAPGIPRIQMPVIEPSDIALFQKRLNDGRVDLLRPFAKGKFVFPKDLSSEDGDWVDLGWSDGDSGDDVTKASIKKIAVGKLKPTQNQIWLEKTFGNIAKHGPPKSGSPVLNTTVIVSSDGYILDGHHRYSQAMMADPGLRMKALYVPIPIKKLLEIGRAYGEAIGNKAKQGTHREARGAVKVEFSRGVGSVSGTEYAKISDLVSAVEGLLRRNSDTVILGPKLSVGPTGNADPYGDAPYSVKNLRGEDLVTGYSTLSLWEKHWPKILGWRR